MHANRSLPPPRIPAALRLTMAGLLAVAAVAVVSPRAFAQDAKDLKLKLHFSFKDAKDTAKGGVSLRPNVPQEVFVFVENEDEDADQEVTVQLIAGGAPELSQKLTVKKGDKARVAFEKAPPAAKALPGAITFRVLNKEGKYNTGLDARLQVARPRTYVNPSASYSPGESNRFEMTVSPKADAAFTGPAAKAELDISPGNIPGLTPGQKKAGRYSGFLPLVSGAALTLEARDLKFDAPKDHKGVVYATVDGYQRAIAADTTFALTGAATTPDLNDDPTISLPLPAFSRPATLTVPVHADGNIAWDDRIKIQLAAGKKKDAKAGEDPRLWADVASFTGPREVKYAYAAGPGGGLLVTPAVADWKAVLDFSGVFEPTEVRLVIEDKGGTRRNLRNGITRAVSGDAVIQSIVFDDTPPDVLEFETPPPPAVAYKGRDIRVFARARDSESGITEVYFHAGKPGESGKLPPGAVKVPANAVEDSPLWEATFTVGTDIKGPFEVTVVAVNGVGLSSTRTLTLPRQDPPPDFASVAGRVFEMENAVDNLPVVLVNDKGEEVAVDRTAGGGKFIIRGVLPGLYALSARKESNGFRAVRRIVIEGKEQLVDKDLKLEAPPEVIKAPKKDKEEKKDEKNARIKGTVVEGPRPQAGVPVNLTDLEAKKVVGTTKTNAEGAYEFKDLPKGRYAVTAARSASMTTARKDVDLAAGEEKAGVELKLFR